MKVRVCYTIDIDDNHRRAIREHYGRDGLATRSEIVDWYRAYGTSADDDLAWTYSDANPENGANH